MFLLQSISWLVVIQCVFCLPDKKCNTKEYVGWFALMISFIANGEAENKFCKVWCIFSNEFSVVTTNTVQKQEMASAY